MKELRSFKDVIENQFFDEFERAINDYVLDNLGRLDLRSYRVQQADEVLISDLIVKYADIYDALGDGLRFDVIVEVEMEIAETVRLDRKTDKASKWLRVSCKVNLNNGLRDFEITNVDTYSRYASGGIGKMTDELVPVIAKEQFDTVAAEFLNACGYGEAVTTPMPLPAREVAARMGLTIKETRLSRHLTIFGAMVFNDCIVKYYDTNERTYKPMALERKTILLDPNTYFMCNLGCRNNTVIHECIHWFKHRKYHELAAMYDGGAACIQYCQVHERGRYRKDWKPEDWMEWQANGIAPRVLMPKEATIKKIEELFKKYELMPGAENRLSIMEGIIFELADFFKVSRQAAKIRMLDLGYMDVEGVAIYVDDHYISSYAFAADSKDRNQTFTISLRDSFLEYSSNAEFRKLIDSGNFTYIDGHYVINDPKYIIRTPFGGLDLTDYAKLHVDECCLRFDLAYNKLAKNDITVYLDTVEFRKATSNFNRVPSFKADDHNLMILNRSKELKKFHEEYIAEGSFLSRPTLNYAQTVWAHIERLGLSRKDFCEKTLLSEKTYDRIRDNDIGKPSLDTVMRICIGLELGGILGEQLLELAGYKLNAAEIAYKKLLYSYKGHDIYECDEVLCALGLPTILPKQYRAA